MELKDCQQSVLTKFSYYLTDEHQDPHHQRAGDRLRVLV